MNSRILEVRELTIGLPSGADRSKAVDSVSFSVEAGEIVCLVGESGSGKTVSAKAVVGLLPIKLARKTTGSIRHGGIELLGASPQVLRELRGRRIGIVFQEPMNALNPVQRVGAQINELFRIHGLFDSNVPSRILELLATMHLPEPSRILRAYPHELSGGQRQRVMIAMALALKPDLLIADEPTTALDVLTQHEILALLKDMRRREGISILLVTHDLGVVASVADTVIVMRDGAVRESGTASQVLGVPRDTYTKQLIAASPKLQASGAVLSSEKTPILTAINVSKYYATGGWPFLQRKKKVLSVAKLEINAGEIVALVGESGCGKSTLARCIAGLTECGGQIRFKGRELATRPTFRVDRARNGLQMIFQDPSRSLNPKLRIEDSLIESALNLGQPRRAARAHASTMIEIVGLNVVAMRRFPHEFSGGQRQRICIARALMNTPDLLIADEATSSLDVSVQRQILDLLLDLRRRFDLSMLFITHDLRVASQIADRIAVMRSGRLVEFGPTRGVLEAPLHSYTRELLGALPGSIGNAN